MPSLELIGEEPQINAGERMKNQFKGGPTNTQSHRVFWRNEDGFDFDLVGGGLADIGLSTFWLLDLLSSDFFATTSATGSAGTSTGATDFDSPTGF